MSIISASTYQRIDDCRIRGMGLQQVADNLNRHSIPSPTPGPWDAGDVEDAIDDRNFLREGTDK
jgi:hypothetical protein